MPVHGAYGGAPGHVLAAATSTTALARKKREMDTGTKKLGVPANARFKQARTGLAP